MKERPPAPPPRPSEEGFAFVQDLEFEDWGNRWDEEAMKTCRTFLKKMHWGDGLDHERPDERILAAYDAMYEEDVNRTATRIGKKPEDLPDYRDAQRHSMQRMASTILKGERRMMEAAITPRMFGKALQRMAKHLR
jgi:hypothetical protein